MAKIPLSKIDDYFEEKLEKLLRAAVLDADSLLKQASPVDTGRFRASWQVGENSFSGKPKPPGQYQSTPPIQRVGYGQETLGNVYSVYNNLPYAEKLAFASPGSGTKQEKRYNPARTVKNWDSPGGGSSIQTNGPGWIQGIAKDLQGRVSAAARKIRSQG